MLVDTHSHIHFKEFADDADAVIERARAAGVAKLLCVGCNADDSARAVAFVHGKDNAWATVGLHPHDAAEGQPALDRIATLAHQPKVVAIGECGLDYFRNLSPRDDQLQAFRYQIELALRLDLPMVFHVRDAWEDFFDMVDGYPNLRGVVHCFTAGPSEMQMALDRGFYIALNGIMTFTKDQEQLAVAKTVPRDRLVLETDCPFLTPVPHRGKRNEPSYIGLTAAFLAELRGENEGDLRAATTKSAEALFGI
jgi:TatD DNase family protein